MVDLQRQHRLFGKDLVDAARQNDSRDDFMQRICAAQEHGDVMGVITLYFVAQERGFIPEWTAQVGTETAHTILMAIQIARRIHG